MNENSSSNSSASAPHHGLTAEAISRRAYELWEQEGRPENRDLHHWLRAEQELMAEQSKGSSQSSSSSSASSRDSDWLAPEKDLLQQNKGSGTGQASAGARQQNTDQPLQTARTGAPATKASPPAKRGSSTPFGADKSGQRSGQPGARNNSGR